MLLFFALFSCVLGDELLDKFRQLNPGFVGERGLLWIVVTPIVAETPASTRRVREGEKVTVNYRGFLLENYWTPNDGVKGRFRKNPKEFDSNEEYSTDLANVITGWKIVLPRMVIGSKWIVFIPSNLAYGSAGNGRKIPPNAPLVFEITVIGVTEKNGTPWQELEQTSSSPTISSTTTPLTAATTRFMHTNPATTIANLFTSTTTSTTRTAATKTCSTCIAEFEEKGCPVMLHSLLHASSTANDVIEALLPDGCQSTLHQNSECIFRAILFCGETADAVQTIASANAADDDDNQKENTNKIIYIGAGVVVFLLFGMFAMVIDIQSSRTRRRGRVLMDRDITNTVRIDNPTFGKGTTTAPAVSTPTPDGNQPQGVNDDGNHRDEDASSDSDAQSASCQDWDTDEDSSDSDAQTFQGEDTGVAHSTTTFQGEDTYQDVPGAQSTTFHGEGTYEDVTPNNMAQNTPFAGIDTYEDFTEDGTIDTRMAANATYESIATTSSSSQDASYDTMATTYDQLPTLDAEEDDE